MRKSIAAALAAFMFAAPVNAATVPYLTGPWDPGNAIGILNQSVIGAVNSNVPQLNASPRNLLDNGAMTVNQRAVTATAATTGGCAETSYSPDRWCADVNQASGAGQLAVVTSSPSPPLGFVNSFTLVRNSGSLGQPQCAWQELPTPKATQMQGQAVNFAINLQALAGLSADNGNLAQIYVITGTGTAQGLGALRSAVGMTTTVKQASVTVATTGIITYSNSLVAGQPVYFGATTIPTGFTSGQIYYVSTTNLSSSQFSVATTYAAAIAGTVLAPSSAGNTVNVSIPYITPVWTGLAVYGANGAGAGQTSAAQAFGQATAQPLTLSASGWTRFNTGPISIGSTVTEAAVAVCFWPNTATSGGSTDGIAGTGAQLEILGPNQVTGTPFEFRSLAAETQEALRYAWIIPEPAAAVSTPFTGFYATTTDCELSAQTPVPMDVIPAISFTGTALSTSTFKIVNATGSGVALASTFLVSSTLSTPGLTSVRMASTTGASTAGWGCQLIGNNAGAVINVGADF